MERNELQVYFYFKKCIEKTCFWYFVLESDKNPKQMFKKCIDLGKPRGCSTNTVVITSLIKWFGDPVPSMALRRRQAQPGWDGASSDEIDYVADA